MGEWFLGLERPAVIYLILFLLLIGGGIGLPIPEDLPLVLGGIVLHRGNVSPGWLIMICYIGVMIGDLVIFFVGRRLGPSLFEKPWFKAKVSSRRLKVMRLRLEKRSLPMIFVARHLFYLRTATFLTCGAVGMKFSRFLLADLLAAAVSVPLMVWLGYKFSVNYEDLLAIINSAKNWSLLLIPVAVIVAIYIWRRSRRKKPSETSGKLHNF